MKRIFDMITTWVLSLPRSAKRGIALIVDICICLITTWLAFYLRQGEFVSVSSGIREAVILSIVIALPLFANAGLYRAIFRFSEWSAIYAVGRALALYSLIYFSVLSFINVENVPRTIGIIQPMLLFFGVAGSRLFVRFWLGGAYRKQIQKAALPRVIIYGCGPIGRQLAGALSVGHEMTVIGFFDDDERLHGNLLNGFPIYSPDDLSSIVATKRITHVLLAMPSVSKARQKEISDHVAKHRVEVRLLPSIVDIASGRVTVSDFIDLNLDEVLGRDSISPNQTLLSKKVTGKTVLVTGAGGSIGSELCRQILVLNPKILLLVEISEFGLYSIQGELESMKFSFKVGPNVRIIPLLGSVQDSDRVSEIMSTWRPETVYHAAAYKHVPMVEHNLTEGVKNNVIGTWIVAEAAIDAGTRDFVLVSTDKAVRPTNVMGATKRLAEMALQALHAKVGGRISFSMVRFGNVLESSGSVIPKFRSQIREGGPITVTHPEVTRFFMTIPEAAQLVIQASALADGGDVFVLDMGKPIKIIDLARRMIHLAGLTEKTDANPSGDIAIEILGLRPGEKLYEELLLEGSPGLTVHPKIMKANEKFVPWFKLRPELDILKTLAKNNDVVGLCSKLHNLVEGFEAEGELVDWVYGERKKSLSL